MHPKAKAIRVYDDPQTQTPASQRWTSLTRLLPVLVLAFVAFVMMVMWLFPGALE